MENRDIRIAFFDIDGTLLPPDHHLPESTVAALNILRAPGVFQGETPALSRCIDDERT